LLCFRPSTDYLFDYGYYGDLKVVVFFSQQLILAEGGFKSKLNALCQSMDVNGYTIWNWIELYGDAGLLKTETKAENCI
jgi:hypothetical protein